MVPIQRLSLTDCSQLVVDFLPTIASVLVQLLQEKLGVLVGVHRLRRRLRVHSILLIVVHNLLNTTFDEDALFSNAETIEHVVWDAEPRVSVIGKEPCRVKLGQVF